MTKFISAFAATALVASTSFAVADDHGLTAIALSGDKMLHKIDVGTATVKESMEVSGVNKLLGIDLRPATGQLIGVSDMFEIVEIDPATGAATVISTMDMELPIEGDAAVIVDFNPMANKLRFMSGTTNHRVDIESGAVTVDGSLAYEDADMHAGEAPAIVAAAYVNSYGMPDTTAMYDIDSTIVAVIQQTSPNDGTLAAIGKLGIEGTETYAFDVATDADGVNTAWLVSGAMLYTVSLETGAVQDSWELMGTDGATVRDITFMTAM
ncbi:hypothetical protein AQS8620_03098 [Aquimixticola soesokkakensis]|uniref:DUF4394 domain-containing protein n=1 Tax=Aquimixticola soesokkakensis TaxID=1519096 RepID=A0A1Y5TLC5_9RHOB|nr:DUF4394 domain-containing protein [Aquimixticola soesokkakensis]SLN66736.1 hypothetical protein AQS8620_03098 [Aquimixticola soesokkakensis]